VDATANTITIAIKNKTGVVSEQVVKLAASTRVLVDGKEAKLEAVPKGAVAAVFSGGKGAAKDEVTGVHVTGPSVSGVVKQVDASSLTITGKGEKDTRVIAVTAATK
jgi:hypothetical protein